jgi:hypothetical protein
MECFDELVTDPTTLRLADVETHLATLSRGDEASTGATGRPPPPAARADGASSSGTRASGPSSLPPITASSTVLMWGPISLVRPKRARSASKETKALERSSRDDPY